MRRPEREPYHDNQQFWTVPGERDERLRGRHTDTVTEREPDEWELPPARSPLTSR
jgi:hypothetical protein